MAKSSAKDQPLYEQLSIRLINLPRITRILIAAFFALMVTLAIFPVVDWVYLQYFYNPSSNTLASIVSAIFGAVMYGAGYLLIVGTIGEKPPARKAVLWYVVIGLIALIIVILLLLQGFSMTDGLGVDRL